MKGDACRSHRALNRPQIVVSRPTLAVALALAGLGVACSGNSVRGAHSQDPPPVSVKIEVAHPVNVSDTTEYVATLKSRDSTVIMPQVEGPITQIYVHSGQRVSVGSPLLQIDPAKQEATVKSLEDTRSAKYAELEWARQQYERANGLHASGVASKQALDQAKAELDAAEAQLLALEAQIKEQQVQLRYHQVTAPRNGIVGDIPVRVGDRVTNTAVLTTVDQPGGLEAYVYVPVERSPQLRLNLPVQIVDSEGNVVADSKITFISPQVDNTTQTVLVKARIPNRNDRLRTSQFVRARAVWGTHQGTVVPVLAVSRIGGQYFAFVAEDEKGKLVARQRPLRLGDMVGNDYVVLEGIRPGDKVIVSGTQFLVDGAPVVPQS